MFDLFLVKMLYYATTRDGIVWVESNSVVYFLLEIVN